MTKYLKFFMVASHLHCASVGIDTNKIKYQLFFQSCLLYSEEPETSTHTSLFLSLSQKTNKLNINAKIIQLHQDSHTEGTQKLIIK